MSPIAAGLLCAALTGPWTAGTPLQTKTITGEMQTVTATIEAIEQSSRTVTLKTEDGEYETIVVPEEVARFSELKVGDRVTARYYDNIVLRLKQPGEKDVDSASLGVTPSASRKPGMTESVQRTITATITEIDRDVPSITFSGPNGWRYSSKVEDKAALAKVQVGDKVDITWTEAVMISVGAPK